jgi:hypothetical protein
MAKVKVISNVVASIIKIMLNYIESKFVAKIPSLDVRQGIILLLDPIRKMLDALSDEEPRNKEQVTAIWRNFVNTDFADYSNVQLEKLVSGIEQDQLRAILAVIVTPAIELMRAVTDDEPANDEQAKAILDKFLANPDVHEVVLHDLLKPILLKAIKDEATVAIILTIIAEAIKNAVGGSLNNEQKKRVAKKLEYLALEN